VVVEVVAREVGEDRAVVLDAAHAPLVEPVAGDFHRHHARAAAQVLGERALQHDRIRRGVLALDPLAHHAVAERADHGGAPAERVAGRRDPLRYRGLAVGAGHAGDPQGLRGIAVDVAGDLRDPPAQVVDAEVGDVPGVVPAEGGALEQHRGRAARDRLGNVVAAVEHRAREGGEYRPHLHRARIGGEVGERHAQLREPVEELHALGAHEVGRGDHPSTFFAVATLIAGAAASGGTAIIRSAEPITEANTGALTSPP
jgi:hypothetical protein